MHKKPLDLEHEAVVVGKAYDRQLAPNVRRTPASLGHFTGGASAISC